MDLTGNRVEKVTEVEGLKSLRVLVLANNMVRRRRKKREREREEEKSENTRI